MKLKHKFLWFVAAYAVFVLLLIFAVAFLLSHQLSPSEKDLLKSVLSQSVLYIIPATVFIIAGFGLIIEWMFRGYITPIRKLTEEVALIVSANALS